MQEHQIKRDIFGHIVPDQRSRMKNQPADKQTVAICHYYKHKGSLSVKMMKEHECLTKQCPYLEKLPHAYWERKVAAERKKKKQQKASEEKERVLRQYRSDVKNSNWEAVSDYLINLIIVHYDTVYNDKKDRMRFYNNPAAFGR